MPQRRTLSEPAKKTVAARQSWRCSECRQLLPPTYQVDHTTPLCDGGADTVANCTAMCPNCHATKTQREAIARATAPPAQAAAAAYDNRTDVFAGGVATCTLCMQSRPEHEPHVRCLAIDLQAVNTLGALDRFRFTPRGVGVFNVHQAR
ncbi:MAG: HNH endonuclease [Limisphaerales bacterium]